MIRIEMAFPTRAVLHTGTEGPTRITCQPEEPLIDAVIEHLVRRARRDGTRLIAQTDDAPPTWLAVDPTGTVTPLDEQPAPAAAPEGTDAASTITINPAEPALEAEPALATVPAAPAAPRRPNPFTTTGATPAPATAAPQPTPAPAARRLR